MPVFMIRIYVMNNVLCARFMEIYLHTKYPVAHVKAPDVTPEISDTLLPAITKPITPPIMSITPYGIEKQKE